MSQNTKVEVGTLIWRGITGHVKGPFLDKLECAPTNFGSYMFKADSGRGHFTDQMVAFSASCNFGLVCFVDEPPKGDWTHFEVIRVNRNGKSVVVCPVRDDPETLFNQYKGIGNCRHLLPPLTTLNDIPLPV